MSTIQRRRFVQRPLFSSTTLLIAFLSLASASSFAQDDERGTYIWTNNKNTPNAGPGGEVAVGTYIEISVYIAPSAKVLDSASVTGRSRIYGNAVVRGQASVEGNARIYGNAIVEGQATVSESAAIFGNALIGGDAIITGTAKVTGQTQIRSGTVSSGLVDKKPSAAEVEAINQAAASANRTRQANDELYARLVGPIDDLTATMVAELNSFPVIKKTGNHHRINYHFEKLANCQILMDKNAIYDGGHEDVTVYIGESVASRVIWNACLPGHYAMDISGENYGAIKFVGHDGARGAGYYSFPDNFSINYQDGTNKIEGHEQLLKSLQDYRSNVVALYDQIPEELKSRIAE